MDKDQTTSRKTLQERLTGQLPLLWAALAFAAGIVLGSLFKMALWTWLMLLVLSVSAAFFLSGFSKTFTTIFSRSNRSRFFLIIISIILFGAMRLQAAIPGFNPTQIAYYNDRDYELLVTGTISSMPDLRDTYTNLRLRVEAVDTGAEIVPVKGIILARVSRDTESAYGEKVRLRGRLETPPENEDFSYRDYLARQNIHAYMAFPEVTVLPERGGNPICAAIYALKGKSLFNVYRLFPDPEASLLAGILLGVDTGLSRGLQEAFNNTGTAHIIAISGFNITIIAGVFTNIFSRWLGPRRGSLIAALGIAFYTFLVGANATVVRAAIMGTLALFARQIGRRNLALNTLSITALIMLLGNPLLLWDAGFQLSFLATLGLILYTEPFSQFTLRLMTGLRIQPATQEKILQPISDLVLLTYAAQLTTFPIMAYHFKRISLAALIANPFILPAQPAVMILGGLAVFISLLIFPIGQAAAWIAWPFTFYTIWAVEFFDRLPHGNIYTGNFSLWVGVLYYAALFGITFGWPRIRAWFTSRLEPLRAISIVSLFAGLFICGSLAWRGALNEGDGRLRITFLEVGSGDAILVQTPAGRNILINGGPSTSQLSDQLGRRLPLFRRKLDWLVIASTAENEVAALPRVLERYPPEQVLWSGNVQASYSSRQLDTWLAEENVPVLRAEEGQRLDLGDGVHIEVAAAGGRGSVLILDWNQFRLVLPIGIDADTMAELEYGETLAPADGLLLVDSGYAPSNPGEWIEKLNPQVVILSVAAGDADGLPDEATLERLAGR